MTSSHNLALTKQSSLEKLLDFVQERGSADPTEDLEKLEREIHGLCAEVERELVAAELAHFDVDVPVIEIDGVTHRRVLRCEETYFGAAGPLRVMRTLYATREGGSRAECPLERRAGVLQGRWTPLAAKQATWAVSHMTPHESEEMFGLLGGMTPSKSSLDRLAKQLGQRWEEERLEFEEQICAEEEIPDETATVAVSLDGVMIPMKDGERTKKRATATATGKRLAGPAGYEEAGCATLSLLDAEGNRLKTIRMARMPEPKKEGVKYMLSDEVEAVLKKRPDLTLVKIADGARDNWAYFKKLPAGEELVDFYHAATHLNEALAAAYGKDDGRARAQFVKLRHVLRHEANGVEKVLRSLRHLRRCHPRRKKIATEVKYFQRYRRKMRYAAAAKRGLPIGSGVVEAACKTLVTQRMKRSGMRWRPAGGQAILTFRSLIQSNRFDRGWKLLKETYRSTVALPRNVVAFRAAESR